MKFSCCIELLFAEHPFVERIYRARELGFDYIEFWTWEDKDIAAIRTALDATGIGVGVFQGNTTGRMVATHDRELYLQGVQRSVEVAQLLGAKNLFLMSDIMQPDRTVKEGDRYISPTEKLDNASRVLRDILPIAEQTGITFLIEPLNTKVDHKGYSLCNSHPAFELIRGLNHHGVRVLYDAYHMQIMEGNIIQSINDGINEIGYFHVADVPGRLEPGMGELNYPVILNALDRAGYQGIVGFEFSPSSGNSTKTLQQLLQDIKTGGK